MSRRARRRAAGDKRAVDFDSDNPHLERAFQTLTAERKPREDDDSPITLEDGSVVDLAKPWAMPSALKN